jgi:hypothetical protein
MKDASLFVAGLAIAILSIAPANAAQPANAGPTSFRSAAAPWVGCSGSAGTFSPTAETWATTGPTSSARRRDLKSVTETLNKRGTALVLG